MVTLLAQYNYKVNKPIIPTVIHDDLTRLLISLTALPILLFIVYKILRYYDGI